MYAITFDLDNNELTKHYTNNKVHFAYSDIDEFLNLHGFKRQQGLLYFGNETIDGIKTVMAVNAMSRKFEWFKHCVNDIRMLRIEEVSDLSLAL